MTSRRTAALDDRVLGCCEGMETVARELVRRHVLPDFAFLSPVARRRLPLPRLSPASSPGRKEE